MKKLLGALLALAVTIAAFWMAEAINIADDPLFRFSIEEQQQ